MTSCSLEALHVIDGIGEEGAKRIRIGIAKDGSGVGAALIALVAAGMEKNAAPAPPGTGCSEQDPRLDGHSARAVQDEMHGAPSALVPVAAFAQRNGLPLRMR